MPENYWAPINMSIEGRAKKDKLFKRVDFEFSIDYVIKKKKLLIMMNKLRDMQYRIQWSIIRSQMHEQHYAVGRFRCVYRSGIGPNRPPKSPLYTQLNFVLHL